MKKLLIPLLFLAMIPLQGCTILILNKYTNIRSYSDDLNNERRHLLTRIVMPREWLSNIGSATMLFEKRGNPYNSGCSVYISIERGTNSFRSEESGYLKADGEVFPLLLRELSVERDYDLSVDDDDGGDFTIDRKITEKFRIELTPAMIAGIADCRRAEFRFYFGPEPATYRLKGSGLRKVKRLLRK